MPLTPSPNTLSSGRPVRVLLADDDTALAGWIRDALAAERSSAVLLEHVLTLSDAAARLSAGPAVHLVLLGQHAREGDSWTWLARLKQACPMPPVIALVATQEEADALAALQSGADDYLWKRELEADSLVRAIQDALEARSVQLVLDGAAGPGTGGAADAAVGVGGETILVVDDESGVREDVCEGTEMAGYRVLEADSAESAVRICRELAGSIDLLLTDVMMPGVTGQELAEHLSTLAPGLRVLYMSGDRESVQGIESLDPTERFIQKPFNLQSLLRKIRGALDAPI